MALIFNPKKVIEYTPEGVYTYYRWTESKKHPGYANLAKIAKKHNNLDLWYKYWYLANVHSVHKHRRSVTINHTKFDARASAVRKAWSFL